MTGKVAEVIGGFSTAGKQNFTEQPSLLEKDENAPFL